MMEDDIKLSGYYEVIGVEHTKDSDHGSCILVEIKDEYEDTIQIGFYHPNQRFYHTNPKKVSVLKKGHHY